MKLIVDFDRTIFDVERLYQLLGSQGVRELAGTIQSLEYLSVPELLFSDAVTFFQRRSDLEVHVVSSAFGKSAQWDFEYQQAKIERSLIENLVSAVHVVKTDKVQTIKDIVGSGNAVFVDDLEEHLVGVTNANKLVVGVLIDRNQEYKQSQFKTIKNFSELDVMIENI